MRSRSKDMFRIVLIWMVAFLMPICVDAQEDDFSLRLELAEKMIAIRPAQEQLDAAVDVYINNYMFAYRESEQEIFRTAMMEVMNPKALDKIAVDAYAETFTLQELQAMVEYYTKPEAISAREKQKQLDAKMLPEMTRMLDQALMRVRTAIKRAQ